MSAAVITHAPRLPIPASAGIGFRSAHERAFLEGRPAVPWLEVHSENYLAAGGEAVATLMKIRCDYAVSFHGVGLSLGSTDPLDRTHLRRLQRAINRFEPALVSEHLAWSSVGGRFVNDLLPLPATREALELLVLRVDEVQDALGRAILIENISSYLELGEREMPEHCFLVELAQRTGCGILLDVNNLYVSERNHGVSAAAFIDAVPAELVGEIHLAGHSVRGAESIVVDTHDGPVCEAVWALYARALAKLGRVPTLIEWDSNLPPLDVLIAEARKADFVLAGNYELAA